MITLEDINESDFEDIRKMTSKKSIMKFIGNGKIWDDRHIENFIHYNLKEQKQNHNKRKNYYYKIVSSDARDGFVGIIGAHSMVGRKGFYLTIMIEKEHQEKGYYRQSLELLKDKLNRVKFGPRILISLVRKSNKRMNEIGRKRYYFNGEVRFKGEEFNEYYIFLRKLTYMIKTESLDMRTIGKMMKERGIWRPFKYGKDRNPDFLHVDAGYHYDPKLFKYEVFLKNILVNNEERVTNKDNLYKNLSQINGGKRYLVENHSVSMTDRKENYKKYFKKGKVWIIKPMDAYAGAGIEILESYDDFLKYFVDIKKVIFNGRKFKNFVLQEYIMNPFLYKGRKFHLRYHFICYNGEFLPIKNVQVITAAKKYKTGDFKNKDIHDTHFKDSLREVYFPHSFKELSKDEIDYVNNQFLDCLNKCVSLVKFECWPEARNCYQTFGADFMILDDLSVKLLEVNGKISLKLGVGKYVDGDITYNDALFRDELEFVVDKVFPPSNKS